ncbi:MAG: hypothetical protein D6814_15670 [Calditrichaeota bacterium]|nr:MAG: hypothetical protein D6814_15670 [Calditrichota bacterium]
MKQNIDELYIDNEDRIVVIISDFHMGEGFLAHRRVYSRSENFFHDDAFYGFIKYLKRLQAEKNKPVTLIINGDFLDFIRIRTVPGDREHKHFLRYLKRIGHDLQEKDVTIDATEKNFGLNAYELKSVWKLQHIANGHPRVFEALAEFVVSGNRLIIVKGNHDLEFYWPAVQKEFRKILARMLPSVNGAYKRAVERMEFIESNVEFVQKAVIIDRTIYIEHGHQYQPITRVEGPPQQNGELSLPPGSILNRYLINAIETIIPFINNIRPVTEVFHALGFKQKFQALRILLSHLPRAGKIMYRRYRKDGLVLLLELLPYMLTFLYFVFGFALPMIWKHYEQLYIAVLGGTGEFLMHNWFLHLLLIFLGFETAKWGLRFAGRTHYFDLNQALRNAREKVAGGTRGQKNHFLVLSHTHKPEVCRLGENWWYVNTGTWIPILDRKEILMHEKMTMSFVQFEKNQRGQWDFELMQWNDAKGRGDKLILLES